MPLTTATALGPDEIYAPPPTFMVDGRQMVVLPAGSTLTAFALQR